MTYTFQEIQQILTGKPGRSRRNGDRIDRLLVDSRQLTLPETTLFFALAGPRRDGHDFVTDLYEKGVHKFVVHSDRDFSRLKEAHFIRVPDTLLALQKLSAHHRQKFQIPVIGITGSNGKTTVKEWLFHLLSEEYNIVKSPKSYNSQIGVPLSLWLLFPGTNLALIEAGISQKNEMEILARLIKPTIGVITNIGSAHDAGFASKEEKAREKSKLFETCQTIVYCHNHSLIHDVLERIPDQRRFSWTQEGNADLVIKNIQKSGRDTLITGVVKEGAVTVCIPYTDTAAVENAIHCLAICTVLGKVEKVKERFKTLPGVEMRLESKSGINSCRIIDDVYNSDLESISIALSFAQQQSDFQRKTIIISDLLQSAQSPEQLYKKLGSLLNEKGITRVIGVGERISLLDKFLLPDISRTFFPDTRSLLSGLGQLAFERELVLIKGARFYALEKVVDRLTLQRHSSVLEVNLGAIARNLKTFEQKIEPSTRIMVMVKASAYGSGSHEVVRFLQSRKIDYMAVAYLDEAIDLRKSGISLPVMVMNPDENSIESYFDYDVEPEIYSFELLDKFIQYASTLGKRILVHIKIDTGMHRLGFCSEDLSQLANILKSAIWIRVGSVFSHLAAADDPKHDSFTLKQCRLFEKKSNQFVDWLDYKPLRHLLNSNGIVRFPQYQFDMVRLGIGLYGIGVVEEMGLEPTHTLKATISQIKKIPAGDSVGYGRFEVAANNMRIGVLNIGYADGLMRNAGNRRFSVLIREKLAPIVGNICMDMCMVDVTHIPEVEKGDEAIIFGSSHPIESLAEAAGTIPYEIFTGISPRVKRIFINE